MQVSRWGNSLAVRLPRELVESLSLKPGDERVVVASAPGVIEVAKGERRRRALDELAALNWNLPDDYRFDREEANSR